MFNFLLLFAVQAFRVFTWLEMVAQRASIATVLKDKHRLSGRRSGTSQDAIHQDDELGNRWIRDKRVGG